jgi:hypothetical protein
MDLRLIPLGIIAAANLLLLGLALAIQLGWV